MTKYFLVFLFSATFLFADEVAESKGAGKLSHESEAGVVISSGNSDTQTYSAKQATVYSLTGNSLKLTASYLLGKTTGVETAKKWDLGLRYERTLTDVLSAFMSYQIDSSPFAGTQFRHSIDLGAKYAILKSTETELSAEAGYKMTAEKFTTNNGLTTVGSLTSHFSRVYLEWKQNWNKSVSTKFWGEYLQSYTNTKDYRFNVEPSLSILLSDMFSVKMAYLITYRNAPAVAGKKQTDTLYTTSLVAKF